MITRRRTANALKFSGSRRRRPPRRLFVVLGIALVGLTATATHAAEPAEEFVQGLHERGLYDLALDYLERMETSRLASEDFRRQIPYHRGVTLIEQSRQTVDPDARSRLLDEARTQLEQFAATNPESVQTAEAQLQLATVLVEQGKRDVARADQLPEGSAYDAERDRLRQQARESFEAAAPMFRQAEATYNAELNRLPQTRDPDDDDDDQSRQRQEYRGRLAQVRVMAAQTQFETAQTHPSESPEFRQLNEAAAQQLAQLYEDHSRWLVGFYARLYEGRCYQALGQYPLALGCYEEILSQSSVLPAFRALIAKAYRHRAECFLAEEKYDAAIESSAAWLKEARPTEERQPDWLAVRFQLAEALQRKAETRPDGSMEQRRLLAEAREAYRLVAASPNEFQAAARTASVALGRGGNERQIEPRSFQQAYDLGKDALASMNAARLALPTARENNPSAISELEGQIADGKDDARHYFQAAMSLVEDDTELAARNEVRYFLCWLYWENRDYYRAAVLGEFLARRYPNDSMAAAAAKLAMASYEQLYQQAAGKGSQQGNTEFEARRMAAMAEFITRRWPNTPDADAAFSVLVSDAIRTDRVDEAQQLLTRVSDQYRPRLELQLGAAMWGRYLQLSQTGAADRPDDQTLGQLKHRAVEFLRSGLAAARGERQISQSAATAALYLAQAALNEGQYDEAIRLLEDDETGPLSLVERQAPAALRPAYVVEVYKAALRAFVSVTPPQGERAIEVMNALEQTVRSNNQAGDQLTHIYLGLGVALQQQIDELRSAGRDAEAERVSAAFVEFLDRIAGRQEGSSWAVRSWIAQTYYNLGTASRAESSPTPDPSPSSAAQAYLTRSRDTYRQLLDAAAADASFAPSEAAVLAAHVQLGETYRELGEYQQALDTFSSILRDQETSLTVQRAAALTYQQRGENENYQWFERAIHGGYQLKSTGQNRIWGWLKIAQVAERAARSNPAFRDAFFEARLNVARCRYLAGMQQQGDARRQDVARAKQSIRSMVHLYPDLGGERWRDEFDALLKEVQIAAGQQPLGLREFVAPQS